MSAQAFAVRVAGADVAFSCMAGDTLLRAAQRAGIGFPYECNVGSCGNCKFELVDGEVHAAWALAPGLSDKDRQRKRHLGCQSQPLSDCTIKLRQMPRCVPPHRPERVAATLRARRDITHDISEFSFELTQPLAFEPGQYALAWLPGVVGPRAYSMSNAESGKRWDFQVRKLPAGQGSEALFALQAGQAIEIDGPYGMAWLKRDAPRDILCLAGGSGLAPMVSIARAAMREPALNARSLHFLYGGRTPADICGEDMLRELPGWGTRLSYRAFVSTTPEAGFENSTYEVAYLHDAALRLHAAALPAMEVYFAGPPVMATAVQRMLLDAGVPPEHQHFDQFY